MPHFSVPWFYSLSHFNSLWIALFCKHRTEVKHWTKTPIDGQLWEKTRAFRAEINTTHIYQFWISEYFQNQYFLDMQFQWSQSEILLCSSYPTEKRLTLIFWNWNSKIVLAEVLTCWLCIQQLVYWCLHKWDISECAQCFCCLAELQNCHELHTILRLVLKAGNLMNAVSI